MLSCMLMHYAAKTKKVEIFYEKQAQNQKITHDERQKTEVRDDSPKKSKTIVAFSIEFDRNRRGTQ